MTARYAQNQDIEGAIELLAQMHTESPHYRNVTLDTGKLAAMLATLIESPDGFFVVAEDEGEIVGVMIGCICEYFFSSEKFASEICLYVQKDHRGSWAALRMTCLFVEWAKACGVPHSVAGVSAHITDDRAEDFYVRLGFSPLGKTFVKAIDHVRT